MKRKQTKEPGLAAIRAAAPDDMPWLCVTAMGFAWYQTQRGTGPAWATGCGACCAATSLQIPEFPSREPFAIDLKSGTVHFRQPDGSILEVTKREWDV